MDDETLQILSKYPNLIRVSEAIAQHFRGEQVTARCFKCNSLLTVTAIKAIDTVWVTCPGKCTVYHETYAKGTLSNR